MWLNDLMVGETGLFAAFAGIQRVPVVLLTGDDWACREAEALIAGGQTGIFTPSYFFLARRRA